jgi:hypothetical protein
VYYRTFDDVAADLPRLIDEVTRIQRSGATSLRQIAEALNARGISAPRGGQWHATSVRNVMARA